jgi:hypothetical protein
VVPAPRRLSCDCRVRARVQDGWSCLHRASEGGHLEVVKYLFDQVGGKELLMLTDKVSACGVRVCVFAGQMMMWAGCGDSEVCMLGQANVCVVFVVCIDEMHVWIGARRH